MPVVGLQRFLSGTPAAHANRWVVLRLGERRAALTVDAVIGVAEVGGEAPGPLLEAACGTAVEALATVDRELLLILHATRIVPDGAWSGLPSPEGTS